MNPDFERRDAIPNGAVFCNGDAECAEAASAGIPFIPLAGQLAHSLGASRNPGVTAKNCVILKIDQILVKATASDGEIFHFNAISDLTFGNYWRGQYSVVTSTGWSGGLEACPRAHPGDGVLDHLEVDSAMPLRQRIRARRNMRSGTHLPHPSLRVSRSADFMLEGPRLLTVDGVARGKYAYVECAVQVASAQVVLPMADKY